MLRPEEEDCSLLHDQREPRAAQEAADNVIALSAAHGFTDFLPTADCTLGRALAHQGRHKEGIEEMLLPATHDAQHDSSCSTATS